MRGLAAEPYLFIIIWAFSFEYYLALMSCIETYLNLSIDLIIIDYFHSNAAGTSGSPDYTTRGSCSSLATEHSYILSLSHLVFLNIIIYSV